MGNCLVGGDAVDKKITKLIVKDHARDVQWTKLLLLGTGESGKSTIFKQVKMLYGVGWKPNDLKANERSIYQTINEQAVSLVRASNDEKVPLRLADPKLGEPFGKSYPVDTKINKDIAAKLKALWMDPGAVKLWKARSTFQILECLEYFMQDSVLDRVSADPYIPSFEDVVQCRVRTTGVIEQKFEMFGARFQMYDVGGQRSERRKWVNQFDHVMTVIYVAALNEYDGMLFEDSQIPRLEEALGVWEDVVNRETFQDVGFLLFLNKWDLFEKKVLVSPFRTEGSNGRNKGYTGPDPMNVRDEDKQFAIEQCAEYVKDLFMAKVGPRTGMGAISCHYTTATDTKTMHLVFDSCRDSILRKNLFTNGFGFAAEV